MSYVPWPAECPDEHLLQYWPYSLQMAAEGFRFLLPPTTGLYVELGTYCGASAQLVAQMAPTAKIICVDTWDGRGSPAYETDWQHKLLPLCQANLWRWRDRIDMLQCPSREGLLRVYCAGMQPDLIYIDADHHYEAVRDDLKLARNLFPFAQVCGDDFSEPEVARAVTAVLGTYLGVIGCSLWWEVRHNPQQLLQHCSTSKPEIQERYNGFQPNGLVNYTAIEVRGGDTGAVAGEVRGCEIVESR